MKKPITILSMLLLWFFVALTNCMSNEIIFPSSHWQNRLPSEVGLDSEKLEKLKTLVGGRGCVVRRGYMVYTWGDQAESTDVASALKPVLSTLLGFAMQDGLLSSPDEPIAQYEPGLLQINQGKDRTITWRHLASQTSGYGLRESPGKAWAYNDFALALYYDTLMNKVFKVSGDEVLKKYLGDPLQFEDRYTFEAFGPDDRPGRLALSVRDFARFGYFILHQGYWRDKQLLRKDWIETMLRNPVPVETPRTSGIEADMLPGQRSLGGGKNITPIGPGYYSFNWWLNGLDKNGNRLFVDAPPDTVVASGHGGMRCVWIIPSLDLIVAWNDADIEDHDNSPGNPNSQCNLAVKLMKAAVIGPDCKSSGIVQKSRFACHNGQWFVNGEITYKDTPAEGLLMNVRMVNAVFEDTQRPDFNPEANTNEFIDKLPEYASCGVRAFTIGLQGGMPGYEGAVNSAFHPDGTLSPSYMQRVGRVIDACDQQGIAVILGCYYQRQDQILQNEAAIRNGIQNVIDWLRSQRYTNVLLEIANEFNHDGFNHPILKTPEGEVQLIQWAKRLNPDLLVSTSGLGDGSIPREIAEVSDFILIHFNGTSLAEIPNRIAALKPFKKPIVCNEDDKIGDAAANAAELCILNGASYGLMLQKINQTFPFAFNGSDDDLMFYTKLKKWTHKDY